MSVEFEVDRMTGWFERCRLRIWMECSDRALRFWVGECCWLSVRRRVGSEGDGDAHEKLLTGSSITSFERQATGFVLGCPGITHKDLDDLGNVGKYLAQVQMTLWVCVNVVMGNKSWIEGHCSILSKSIKGKRRRRSQERSTQ